MDWFERRDDGMYGSYDGEGDRCPICHVPVGAPHMNSCDETGIWQGDEDPPEERARQRY